MGTIRFEGRDVRELDVLDLRRRAVLVPQLPAPLPGTVADNVRFGPSLCGRDADVERASPAPGSIAPTPSATLVSSRSASSSG